MNQVAKVAQAEGLPAMQGKAMPCKLVAIQKTATQILEEHAREIAATKLVAKRFPDAILRGEKWTSSTIDTSNTKEMNVEWCDVPSERRTVNVELYVTLRPKGQEPLRVYSTHDYHLTPEHVVAVLQDDPKLLLKVLGHVLKCQETSKSA